MNVLDPVETLRQWAARVPPWWPSRGGAGGDPPAEQGETVVADGVSSGSRDGGTAV